MPSFRGKNLREGDIAEQLGMLLFQSVALIAPIPRTEDVGIDAVVTLLRSYDKRRYIAEDSFFVQIKSSSVESIVFDAEQFRWLCNLELPFFIASIDKSSSTIKLYATHRLNDAIKVNHNRSELIMSFDDDDFKEDFLKSDCSTINIGPPILSWSLSDVQVDGFRDLFYSIAKAHVLSAKQGLLYRQIGQVPYIVWRTNVAPKMVGEKSISTKPPIESRDEAYDLMMPYFIAWQTGLVRSMNFEPATDVVKLLENTKDIISMLQKMAKEKENDKQD